MHWFSNLSSGLVITECADGGCVEWISVLIPGMLWNWIQCGWRSLTALRRSCNEGCGYRGRLITALYEFLGRTRGVTRRYIRNEKKELTTAVWISGYQLRRLERVEADIKIGPFSGASGIIIRIINSSFTVFTNSYSSVLKFSS